MSGSPSGIPLQCDHTKSASVPIRLAENFRAVFYAPFYATQALGFYAREGVEVELLPSPAPAAAQKDLLDGAIDLSWGGPMRVMKAWDGDPRSPLVCFCEVVARDPFFLIGRADGPTWTLADVPRLRLAIVSEVPTPWLCLQHDLRRNGIDPERLDRVTTRTMPANLETLRNGELDVAQMFEPYVAMAMQQGIGKIIYAASTRGPTVYTTFLATRDGIARNRSAISTMVRAVRRMQAWLYQHSAEDLAEVVAPFYPDLAPDLLTNALRRYRDAGLWARYPEVSRDGFACLAESLLSGGFVSRLPAYDDCVDQSLHEPL
jgi:NitT/TauT family transport system substrate-binding protein